MTLCSSCSGAAGRTRRTVTGNGASARSGRDTPSLTRRCLAILPGDIGIVAFAMSVDQYSAEWSIDFPPSNRLLNPEFRPEKIPGLMQKYSEFFGSKVISTPFGWEHIARW